MREMGKGNQGTVNLCTDRKGEERCLKCYPKTKMRDLDLDDLKEEFEAMKLLDCKRIASTFEIFQDDKFYYMVNEVCGITSETIRECATWVPGAESYDLFSLPGLPWW